MSEREQIARADREAHEQIATLCNKAGAVSPDGTSVGAVRDLVERFERWKRFASWWAQHDKDCKVNSFFAGPCSCGFTSATARMESVR